MSYHSDYSRISNSMLGVLKQSPRLFHKTYIERTIAGREETKAMRIGSMTHCLLLENDEFYKRYQPMEKGFDRRRSLDKNLAEEAEAKGQTVATAEEFNVACGATNALQRHDELSQILKLDRLVEHEITFDLEGVKCKSKLDMVVPSIGLIVDIKTTSDASPSGFARSCAEFSYYRQAAFYKEAARQHFGKEFRFVFAVVETPEAYDAAVYELADDQQSGFNEACTLLREYKRRVAGNDWLQPWSRGVVPLDLPRWHKPKIGEEL